MESPRSLLARIKEERAQEQQWKRETARRRRKFKKMEEEQQQNSDYGQLTSEALSSHNKEKIRRKLRSFAHPSSCPTTADSDLTYATSLSRIETGSVASAVPLSLLGAVPPSTAAGQVAPALRGRLVQKVRKNISKEEDRNNETAEEQVESGNTACSSPQQIMKAKLKQDFTIVPAEKSQETKVVDHPPNQSVTKSTKEFLALEKEAVEQCAENSHDQVKAQPSPSIAVVVDAPTVFSALPPIQKTFTKESEPVLAPKEHPVPSSESNNNTQTKKKRGVLPLPKVTSQPQQRTASTSSRPPRQQTAPHRRHEEDTSCPPPKGIIKPPIRRSESAPRAAVRQNPTRCLESVEVVQKSGLEVFRPDAMERQGGRGGAVVAVQSGAENPQKKKKKRAVFFNELANGGDVFVGHDGVQFNVARSIGVNSSMNSSLGLSDAPPARSSGSAISFVQAMRQARQNNNKPPTNFSIPDFELREDPMREEPEEVSGEEEQEEEGLVVVSSVAPPPKPILFVQPNPELFMDDDEEERDQWRSKEGEAEKDNDDEVTRSTPPPPQVLLASERPENVIPTGYSIEEKKLLEALNELNRKQYDQEIKAKGEKKKKTTAFQECSNTGVLSYGMPEPRYQPKKKTNASQGPRETPRLAENLPIRSYVPNSVFNKEVNGCGKRSVAASGASALSRRQAGGRRYLGVQPL